MTLGRHTRLLAILSIGLAGASLLTIGLGLTPLSGSVFGSILGLGPKGDFSLSSNSNSVVVQQGYTGTVSMTISSLNHFSGDVAITGTITTSSNAPVVTTTQSSVKLTPDATISFSLTVTTTSSTTLGNYNITAQGKTSGVSHLIIVSAKITSPPPPPTPDFYLSSNPYSLTITTGASQSATLTIWSILSYSGNVALTAAIFPSGINSPKVFLNLTSLRLPAGGSNSTNYIVNAFNSTAGSYVIIITGISGSLSHTLQVSLTLNPPSNHESLNLEFFTFNSPTMATLNLRNTGTVTTSLVSYYVTDASGDKYALTNWNGPTMAPNQLGTATILIGSSCNGCVLTGAPFTFIAGNTYTISVFTRYGNQFLYTFMLSAQEALTMDSYSFVSSTNLTIYLRNTGGVSVQLVSYYVRDSSGNQYALISYSGPTIAVNQVVPVSVTIGSSCPKCTLSGNPFTFTPGYSYTIIFVTSRSNQFTFTVTR